MKQKAATPPACQTNSPFSRCQSPIQVPQTQSAFICPHNETLSVVAMCVCNPDRSPVGINR
jgi:hypothetical protein